MFISNPDKGDPPARLSKEVLLHLARHGCIAKKQTNHSPDFPRLRQTTIHKQMPGGVQPLPPATSPAPSFARRSQKQLK